MSAAGTVGALAAVLAFEVVIVLNNAETAGDAVLQMVLGVAVAIALGVAGGWGLARAFRNALVPEYMKDNEQSQVVGREIHHGDVVEEKISLSDRFGLALSFYPISEPQYFEIVDHLFGEVADRDQLHVRARRFSMEKGVRSGRTARQFYNQFVGEF